MTDGDDWAFPRGEYGGGVTKREWMAMEILKSLISSERPLERRHTEIAVLAADDLIHNLNKPKEPKKYG
jgi:hypothetical protein